MAITRITLLILTVALLAVGQTRQKHASESPELVRLRNDFIQATKDYKVSLGKLEASYQKSLDRAQKELEKTKSFYGQGVVSIDAVKAAENEVAKKAEKIQEVHQRIDSADKQIAETLANADQIEREYRKAVTKRASTRQRACPNWTLTASRRQTKRSVTMVFKFVCE